MKKNTSPLKCGTFYHIFNRGIDRTNIFLEECNYEFFLRKYTKYISPIADTYAYCLLKNHFHFLIRVKPDTLIMTTIRGSGSQRPEEIISHKFSHFFNSYAQAVNKRYDRTGGLFETPFRRIAVEDEEYLSRLMYYIHFNPQKHRFAEDFSTYRYSSYPVYLRRGKTFLNRRTGIGWFGTKDNFIAIHRDWAAERFTGDSLFPELD